MDHSHSNLDHQNQSGEPDNSDRPIEPNPKPKASSIESIFPTANANQLHELIAQGHNPQNLHDLINRSQRAA
ncbi:MAG: hypothetical protein JKY43_06035 [Phycisphaerales bacterium]|nr:hypothetical protein [Phycisphaerales bacterium]